MRGLLWYSLYARMNYLRSRLGRSAAAENAAGNQGTSGLAIAFQAFYLLCLGFIIIGGYSLFIWVMIHAVSPSSMIFTEANRDAAYMVMAAATPLIMVTGSSVSALASVPATYHSVALMMPISRWLLFFSSVFWPKILRLLLIVGPFHLVLAYYAPNRAYLAAAVVTPFYGLALASISEFLLVRIGKSFLAWLFKAYWLVLLVGITWPGTYIYLRHVITPALSIREFINRSPKPIAELWQIFEPYLMLPSWIFLPNNSNPNLCPQSAYYLVGGVLVLGLCSMILQLRYEITVALGEYRAWQRWGISNWLMGVIPGGSLAVLTWQRIMNILRVPYVQVVLLIPSVFTVILMENVLRIAWGIHPGKLVYALILWEVICTFIISQSVSFNLLAEEHSPIDGYPLLAVRSTQLMASRALAVLLVFGLTFLPYVKVFDFIFSLEYRGGLKFNLWVVWGRVIYTLVLVSAVGMIASVIRPFRPGLRKAQSEMLVETIKTTLVGTACLPLTVYFWGLTLWEYWGFLTSAQVAMIVGVGIPAVVALWWVALDLASEIYEEQAEHLVKVVREIQP